MLPIRRGDAIILEWDSANPEGKSGWLSASAVKVEIGQFQLGHGELYLTVLTFGATQICATFGLSFPSPSLAHLSVTELIPQLPTDALSNRSISSSGAR